MKTKIINDPVHGFISVEHPLLLQIIGNPWFQRLRRIRQLGLTHMVYPGAQHTRFQHAIGAMHLMSMAVATLRLKGCVISKEEEEAVLAAILLHDIGHGPFSHVLENIIVDGISHEQLSDQIMRMMNLGMDNRLDLAIRIFNNGYDKHFLHQLVSGQLDMDRLDYLKRDSFFTGVSEGVIGSDRIIKMLTIDGDRLAVEAKGVYSIEKFLIARRLMYWQVYWHKTVLVAEQMMIQILSRAKELFVSGGELFVPPSLAFFWNKGFSFADFVGNEYAVDKFAMLDDDDILYSIKTWMTHPDMVLSTLSTAFVNRNLFKVEIQRKPFEEDRISRIKALVASRMNFDDEGLSRFFVISGYLSNSAYSSGEEQISIVYSNGEVKDIAEASDMFDLSFMNRKVTRYYLCYPKWLGDLNT